MKILEFSGELQPAGKSAGKKLLGDVANFLACFKANCLKKTINQHSL